MAHELSKVRFNSTNEAMAWGKLRRRVLDGNSNEGMKNLANAEVAGVKRNYERKQKQFEVVEALLDRLNPQDHDVMMSVWGDIAYDWQLYHEAWMYATGERE